MALGQTPQRKTGVCRISTKHHSTSPFGKECQMAVAFAAMDPSGVFWPSKGHVQRGFDLAVKETDAEIVRVPLDLYKAGKLHLDINKPDDGVFPVLAACTFYCYHTNDEDINNTIYHLVRAGANVYCRNAKGETTLHLLCEASHEKHNEAKITLAVVSSRLPR
ncbi:hypothetical protein BBP40_002931 [Aspergillus hancockii]|nr:hypothetical protein BBP40_002931 [Aspergillus hancockii]